MMSSIVFDLVVLPLWLPLWYALFSFYMFHPIVCAILINLLYIILCFYYCCLFGIEIPLLAFVINFPSSHNIVASLCCCSVDHLILIVAIFEVWLQTCSKHNSHKTIYDWYLKTMSQLLNPLMVNLHLLSFLLFHVLQLHVYLFIILSLLMTFGKCLCKVPKRVKEFWHVIMALIQCCIS
jgi:hypothetical protein